MKPLRFLFVACVMLASLGALAQSTIPGKINYQGQLVDSSGIPLTNGDYVVSFRLYNQNAPGGVLMWGPERFDGLGGIGHGAPATLVGGQFNVILDVDTNNTALGSVLTNTAGSYWLEITISTNNPIAPRQQILSAPFALKSGNSEQLSGFGWEAVFNNGNPQTGLIPGGKLTDASITSSKLTAAAVGPGQIAAAAVDSSNIVNAAVGNAQIAPNAINTSQIVSNAVTTGQIAANAITTAQIANGAVTLSKIASNAVGTAQITNGAVTPAQLNLQTGTVAIGQPLGGGSPLEVYTTNSQFAVRFLNSGVGSRYAYFSDSTYAIYCGGNVQVYGNQNINGNLSVIGTLSKSAGSFKIDHPADPADKFLSHSFVESPDMKNIYDGLAVLDSKGEAEVELPSWFQALNRDFRYQLTAVGAPGPNLYIAKEVAQNRFRIAGGTGGMKVSWQVTGIRQDAYAKAHPIAVEENKPAELRGYYLNPEENGQPAEKGIQTVLQHHAQ